MAYLVTGGTGLIGSRIVRDLLKDGEEVVVYDLFPEGAFLEQLLTDKERGRVKIVRGDMIDLAHLIHTVKENSVENIIHMAGLLGESTNANPPLALKVNTEGTINIFETARILGLRKVIWASSIAVFGPPGKYTEEYVPNDALYCPLGIYGACKALNETIAVHYFEQYGLDISAIRYSVVYGPGRFGGSSFIVTRELIEKPAVGKPGKVPYGDATFNWLYVDDAARATVLAAKAVRTKARAFNISGDICSVKEVADYIRKLLPEADITLLPGDSPLHWKYETTPIKEELRFRPRWSIKEAIREMINVTRRQHGLSRV
jgi:UDP-glucose 4-epimerase